MKNHISTVLALSLLLSLGSVSMAQHGGPRFQLDAEKMATAVKGMAATVNQNPETLPHDWVGFAGVRSLKGTILRWTTSSEHNTAWFKIECRNVGKSDWEVADVLPAAGESTTPRYYSWVHSSPPPGELEYRLRQIDRYGNELATGSLRIETSTTEGFSLSHCFPNPANNETLVAISNANTLTGTLVIADLIGRIRQIVFEQQEMLPGSYHYRIDTANLPNGKYLLRLTTSEGVSTRRVVIAR